VQQQGSVTDDSTIYLGIATSPDPDLSGDASAHVGGPRNDIWLQPLLVMEFNWLRISITGWEQTLEVKYIVR